MKRIEYKVEKVNYDELLKVKEINEKVLPENYPFYFYETLFKHYRDAFYVAKVENEIVGYVMCRVEREFTFDPYPKFKKIGHIVSIGVLPEYRNIGIGRELMLKALNSLKNIYNVSYVYLEVRVSNEGAIRFYKRLGFEITNIVKNYYRDGEDAYIMTLYFERSSL